MSNWASLTRDSRRNKTTGFRGIVFYEKRGFYRVTIAAEPNNKHIGDFKTLEEAVLARKEAEKINGYTEILEYKQPKTKRGNTSHSKKSKQAFQKLRTNHGKSGKDI